MSEPTVVHASSLPDFPDCGRRWAAKNLGGMIEQMGWLLRSTTKHVGAAIGTSLHAGMAWAANEMKAKGELAYERVNDAAEIAIGALRHETEEQIIWDDVTKHLNDAERQTTRMNGVYFQSRMVNLSGDLLVEERMETPHESGLLISGRPDIVERRDYGRAGTLTDLKSGRMRRWNAPQYGVYSRQLAAKGIRLDKITEDYLPRVSVKSPQPAMAQVNYEISVAERASENILTRIARDIEAFKEQQAPDAFLANPRSMLCGEKWCPAWGTKFCPESRA